MQSPPRARPTEMHNKKVVKMRLIKCLSLTVFLYVELRCAVSHHTRVDTKISLISQCHC